METNRRLALLIDGDNAQAKLLPQMLAEVSKYGTITIRRVYGDWSAPNLKNWMEIHHIHVLDLRQQPNYTKGKNATDFGLIIDAMDILYSEKIDGFCIVSSDSDYTPLALRLRGQGLFVMGIGNKTTPDVFFEACDEFAYTENLVAAADETPKEVPKPTATPHKVIEPSVKEAMNAKKLKKLLRKAIELAGDNDGWATLSVVGIHLHQLDPEFDPHTNGLGRLSRLVQSYPDLIKVRKAQTSGGTEEIHIRLKVDPQTAK